MNERVDSIRYLHAYLIFWHEYLDAFTCCICKAAHLDDVKSLYAVARNSYIHVRTKLKGIATLESTGIESFITICRKPNQNQMEKMLYMYPVYICMIENGKQWKSVILSCMASYKTYSLRIKILFFNFHDTMKTVGGG